MSCSPDRSEFNDRSSTSSGSDHDRASGRDRRWLSSDRDAPADPTERVSHRAHRLRRHRPTPCKEIVDRRHWPVDVHPLPPLLHNRPERIAGEVRRLAAELGWRHDAWRWGTPTAAPTAPSTRGVGGWAGAGAALLRPLRRRDPGRRPRGGARTYVLTDFLVRSFARIVIRGSAWTVIPTARDSFRHYRRVVWLAQAPTRARARRRRRRWTWRSRPRDGRRTPRGSASGSVDVVLYDTFGPVQAPSRTTSPKLIPQRCRSSSTPGAAARRGTRGAHTLAVSRSSSPRRHSSVAATWLNVKTCIPSTSISGGEAPGRPWRGTVRR